MNVRRPLTLIGVAIGITLTLGSTPALANHETPVSETQLATSPPPPVTEACFPGNQGGGPGGGVPSNVSYSTTQVVNQQKSFVRAISLNKQVVKGSGTTLATPEPSSYATGYYSQYVDYYTGKWVVTQQLYAADVNGCPVAVNVDAVGVKVVDTPWRARASRRGVNYSPLVKNKNVIVTGTSFSWASPLDQQSSYMPLTGGKWNVNLTHNAPIFTVGNQQVRGVFNGLSMSFEHRSYYAADWNVLYPPSVGK